MTEQSAPVSLPSIRFLGVPVERHASIGSTNDEAFRRADEGAPEGLVVLADAQTAGRGRQGRAWWDAPGASLLFSILLRPTLPLAQCPLLALALAPYVTPFGFIWTTYLICSLPLLLISIPKALRLAPVPRSAALAGMVACWTLMQLVQVHDLWPIVAHMVGVIGLIAIALTLMSLESRQAEGRSTPLARATSIASG